MGRERAARASGASGAGDGALIHGDPCQASSGGVARARAPTPQAGVDRHTRHPSMLRAYVRVVFRPAADPYLPFRLCPPPRRRPTPQPQPTRRQSPAMGNHTITPKATFTIK
eukprot:363137-Chlamydomonas_euryale.AAC.3